jgi:hypothetical protein
MVRAPVSSTVLRTEETQHMKIRLVTRHQLYFMQVKIAFIVISLLSAVSGFSIESELPDSSFIWTIRSIGWGNCQGVNTYMISGDTVIAGKQYKQILHSPDSIYDGSSSMYFCAVRDSANLWFFVPGGDSSEYILYDWNVAVGDTVELNNPWADGKVDALIISKDSVLVEDEYKMRLGIGVRQGELWEYWIEDIGCLSGLFYSSFFIFDIGFELSCTYSNGDFYHNFGYAEFCGCWPKTDVEYWDTDSPILLYPNPSIGSVYVSNNSPKELHISFYKMDGQCMKQMVLFGNESKSVKFETKGLIICRIEGEPNSLAKLIQIL